MPGAGCTHGPRATKTHAAEPQVQPEQPAFPAQWFYGLYVISPVTGLCCHRRFASSAKLSASLGAPGPHDFAVRDIVTRLVRYRVHRIPHPTLVTIAKRPSYRRRDAREDGFDLPDGTRGKFASRWHDGQFAHEVYAHHSLRVIASSSEAIQKSRTGNRPDCFVALLLAMTAEKIDDAKGR